MKNNLIIKLLLIGIIILGIICIYLETNNKKLSSINTHNISVHNDTIKIFKDKYNRIVADKKSYEVSLSNIKLLNDSLKELIKNYKPIAIIKWKTKIVYKDSIQIKYDSIIPIKFSYPFKYNSKWLTFNGISSNIGLSINLIEIPNIQSLVIGYKKDGFFKVPYANVSIINSNPYIQFKQIDSYIIRPKKTIFDKWWLWTGVGFISGILILK